MNEELSEMDQIYETLAIIALQQENIAIRLLALENKLGMGRN